MHFTASSSAGSVNQTFTLTVTQLPVFTGPPNITLPVGIPVSIKVMTVSGFPTPELSQSSSDTLPSGVIFNAASGVLSGAPAAGSEGVYTLHFTASNIAGSVNHIITLTVTQPQAPAITSGNSAVFTAGQGGSFTVTATGSPTPTLTESGALPGGVSLTDNGNGTVTLGGTPAVGTQGTYQFTITAHNGVGSDFKQSFTLTVNPIPSPPPPPLPSSPPPPAPPALNVPPLLAFFDSLLKGIETVNADGTETLTGSIFGIPLLVATFDSDGGLLSVTLFGINITFLFG